MQICSKNVLGGVRDGRPWDKVAAKPTFPYPIGIPQDDIEKIFDEFYRAPNAREIEKEGTGLELSIAKEIVERHQGRIWAQNNPTTGCTFSFTLVKKP